MSSVTVYGPAPFTFSTLFGNAFALLSPGAYSNQNAYSFTITASNGNTFSLSNSDGSFTFDGNGMPTGGNFTSLSVSTHPGGDQGFVSGFNAMTIGQLETLLISGHASDLFNQLANGDDYISFSASAFDPNNAINAGAGNDSLTIGGQTPITQPLVLNDTSIQNIETLYLGTALPSAKAYFTIIMADGNVAAGATTLVYDEMSYRDLFIFNASHETDGNYQVIGADGEDDITTGGGNDFVNTGGNGDFVHFLGKDVIVTGAGADIINIFDQQATVFGGAGSDLVQVGFGGRVLKAADKLDGGTDAGGDDNPILDTSAPTKSIDTLYFAGPQAVQMNNTTAVNFEKFGFQENGSGGNYNVKTAEGTVAAGASLTVDASNLTVSSVIFKGDSETDGRFKFMGGMFGTNSIDDFTGGDQGANMAGDEFDFTGSTAATAHLHGMGGNDVFNFFGGAFAYDVKPNGSHAARDQVDGGAGNDVLNIAGDYSALLVFQPNTLKSIEQINLLDGHFYNFQLADLSGSNLSIDGHNLTGFYNMRIDGSHVTHDSFVMTGGAGSDTEIGGTANDVLNGNAGNDSFDITAGGNDTVHGGLDNDIIFAGNQFGAGDQIDGGAGSDTMVLTGSVGSLATPLALGPAWLYSVETLQLVHGSPAAPNGYYLVLDNNTVGSNDGLNLTINGSGLLKTDTMWIDASHVHSGTVSLYGGAGADALVGGTGNDFILGGAGSNNITGGGGADILCAGPDVDLFLYNATSESNASLTTNNYDRIQTFDLAADRFHFGGVTVTAVDNMVIGTTAPTITLDAPMGLIGTALKADLAGLQAGHAVLYEGTDAHLYLVVNAHGATGFHINTDYVIDVTSALHATTTDTGGLSMGSFGF